MVFERTIQGMKVMLRIDGYQSPAKRGSESQWCDCGYEFRFRNAVLWRADHDELFLPEEIDRLHSALTELLDGKITEAKQEILMEPDFSFVLFPREEPSAWISGHLAHPAHWEQDISVAWRIAFWDEGLTDHFLTVTMKRGDIAAFRDFLARCIRESEG